MRLGPVGDPASLVPRAVEDWEIPSDSFSHLILLEKAMLSVADVDNVLSVHTSRRRPELPSALEMVSPMPMPIHLGGLYPLLHCSSVSI